MEEEGSGMAGALSGKGSGGGGWHTGVVGGEEEGEVSGGDVSRGVEVEEEVLEGVGTGRDEAMGIQREGEEGGAETIGERERKGDDAMGIQRERGAGGAETGGQRDREGEWTREGEMGGEEERERRVERQGAEGEEEDEKERGERKAVAVARRWAWQLRRRRCETNPYYMNRQQEVRLYVYIPIYYIFVCVYLFIYSCGDGCGSCGGGAARRTPTA